MLAVGRLVRIMKTIGDKVISNATTKNTVARFCTIFFGTKSIWGAQTGRQEAEYETILWNGLWDFWLVLAFASCLLWTRAKWIWQKPIALLSYSPGCNTRHEDGPGGCIWDPRFGPRGSAMVPIERAVVVCYRLSIVTIDVSLHLASWYAFFRSRLMFFYFLSQRAYVMLN